MLAAIPADSANSKFDISDLVNPVSVLLAAAIAGFVARWNARTSPYGRLQTLINIYGKWPKRDNLEGAENLHGLDTVEKSIAFTLARIRHKDGIPPPEKPTCSEAQAEKEIKRARCVRIAEILTAGLVVGLLIVLVRNGVLPAQPMKIVAFGILGIILGMLPFVWKW